MEGGCRAAESSFSQIEVKDVERFVFQILISQHSQPGCWEAQETRKGTGWPESWRPRQGQSSRQWASRSPWEAWLCRKKLEDETGATKSLSL